LLDGIITQECRETGRRSFTKLGGTAYSTQNFFNSKNWTVLRGTVSYEEEVRLFQAVPREWYPLLIVSLDTGLRKIEQLSLTCEDIDYQKGLIRVRRSRSGRSRYVPMRPIVIETLKIIPRMIDNSFVFYGHIRGDRLKDVPKEWESWLEVAGI
jgi:integrase